MVPPPSVGRAPVPSARGSDSCPPVSPPVFAQVPGGRATVTHGRGGAGQLQWPSPATCAASAFGLQTEPQHEPSRRPHRCRWTWRRSRAPCPRRWRRRPRWPRSAGRLARQVCPPSAPRPHAAHPREASTRARPPRQRAARRSRHCSARCSPRCRASTRG